MAGLLVYIGIILFMVVIAATIIIRRNHIPRSLIKKVNGDVYVRLLTCKGCTVYVTKERYLECVDSHYYSVGKVKDFILGELSRGNVKTTAAELLASMHMDANTMVVRLNPLPGV